MDTASQLTLGFSYPVYMDAAGKIKGSVGGSYDIAPMEDSDGAEIGFMTIFGSASYAILKVYHHGLQLVFVCRLQII